MNCLKETPSVVFLSNNIGDTLDRLMKTTLPFERDEVLRNETSLPSYQ